MSTEPTADNTPPPPASRQLPAKLYEEMEWSKAMALSNLLPPQYRGHAPNLLFAVQYAEALGIPRINALTSIHVIEGKPTMSADLMAARVRAAGHKLRVQASNTVAKAVLIRADDPEFPFEVEFTIEDARQAGLIKPKGNWEKYPRAMLRSRAITEVVRSGASDVMCGIIYTPEEIGAIVDEDGTPVLEPNGKGNGRRQEPAMVTTFTEVPTDAPPALDVESVTAAVRACTDIDCWRELWKQASKAPNFGEVRDAFMKRGEELRTERTPEPANVTPEVVDAEPTEEQAYEQAMLDAEAADLEATGADA